MVEKQGSIRHVVSVKSDLKYKVAISSELGRYMIAAKDLVPGEVIHREQPAVVGPVAFYEGSLCFNCLKPITVTTSKILRCTKCKVASLCQLACELISGFHSDAECELFQTTDPCTHEISKHPGTLLPLRLWLLHKSHPEIWENILQMEDHINERRGTPVWRDRNENVVQILQKFGLIGNDGTELLQRLCGILDVNCFELRSPDNSRNHLLRAIYVDAALIAHDCRGNTHLTVDDEHRLTIYASAFIAKGATIYFNYTASFLGTVERRESLRKGKYFECSCELCSDPYELGSHLSSLVCPRCRKGYVVNQNPLCVDPYGQEAKWQCGQCKSLLSGKVINTTLNLIISMVDDSAHNNMEALESLLQKLLRTIHTNHYLALELKQKLLTSYRGELSTVNPEKKLLKKMFDLCKEILDVLNITEPGISRLKGITLYEMHLPTAMLASKSYSACEITSLELVERLRKAEELLEKALFNLLLEPATTPEGRLGKRALQELKLLRQNITDVEALTRIDDDHHRSEIQCK
ncbi:SET domain-containing protein SmydA-8-like [Athalia rosae]|uniref:SET domain-containing protein SmydA-8-like n=1 Tax=Athalia rosae TaxID=37344 RepID=UPI0020341E83|nr:SET domain-containing protein SmydA-8-like [Athalia rosae]